MTRNKLIQTLNNWKNDADPENRAKNYSIVNSIFPNQEELTIEIMGNVMHKINFSINEFDKVVIENNENPNFSGYVTLKSFKTNLYSL